MRREGDARKLEVGDEIAEDIREGEATSVRS